MADEPQLKVERDGHVLVLTMNNPRRVNGWIDEEDARKIERRFVIEVMGSDDAKEGLAAFSAKRELRFTGK